MMKKYFIIFLIFLSSGVFAQTPLPIYSPNFSSAGGWQINGNATVISSSYLRLTPNAGNQAGSAFWKQKVSLPDNFSFSTYFVSRMTPGSRADGMTFCIQQASNTAGSAGGGLGYQNIPGKSIAIEYDIYNNGEVGGNNHIALDINGVLHGSTNVIASPVNLADGANKYNWIEYNGVTNVLQVRISNTNTRPTDPTLSVTINLATNFIGVSDVYFGFTAATGGATAEHAVYTTYVAPNSTPLSSTGSYSQGVASITLSSSNAISCTALTSTITVTTKDVNGVGMSTNLVMSSDVGGGTLSSYTLTTNSSGIGTVIFTSNAGTLTSNTIRAEEPNVGAYGTVIVSKSGTIPIGGSVSVINSTICPGGTTQLTLSGHTGNINKWQRSTDNINWTNITNTTTSLSESISSTTYYRVEIQATGCATVAYSTVASSYVASTPTPGSVSSYTGISGTLTLSGNTGTVVKWQKSTDNGLNWTDISNTTTSYSYTNLTDGTKIRAVVTNGPCISNSSAGIITLPFTYNIYIYNSDNIGLSSIPVKLYYKLKTDTNYSLYITSNTDISGLVSFNAPYGSSSYEFKLSIDNLVIPTPSSTDVTYLVTKILQQSFNSKDYYRFDTNNNNSLNISDAFLVFYRISGGIVTWTYLVPPYRIFSEIEWNIINTSNYNLKKTYPGTQTLTVTNLSSGSTSKFYLVRTGYKQ